PEGTELVHTTTVARWCRDFVCRARGGGELVGDAFEEKFRVAGLHSRAREGATGIAGGARSTRRAREGAHGAIEIPNHGAQGIGAAIQSDFARTHAPGAGTPRHSGADTHGHRAPTGHDLKALPGEA